MTKYRYIMARIDITIEAETQEKASEQAFDFVLEQWGYNAKCYIIKKNGALVEYQEEN